MMQGLHVLFGFATTEEQCGEPNEEVTRFHVRKACFWGTQI